MSLSSRPVHAIGTLEPLREARALVADTVLRVPQQDDLIRILQESFLMTVVGRKVTPELEMTKLAFGPTTLDTPADFVPGVSSLSRWGGHASITLLTEKSGTGDDEVTTQYELGNGLQYLQLGLPDMRLSKALQYGARPLYSYGWLLLSLPYEVPVQVIIGDVRDPVMLTCVKVTDVTESAAWYRSNLGMRDLPFPLARPAGSQFEPPQPPGSLFLGYANGTPGVLLLPKSKQDRTIEAGGLLRCTRIVVDDSDTGATVAPLLGLVSQGGEREVRDPDGYTYVVEPYSSYRKTVKDSVELQ